MVRKSLFNPILQLIISLLESTIRLQSETFFTSYRRLGLLIVCQKEMAKKYIQFISYESYGKYHKLYII